MDKIIKLSVSAFVAYFVVLTAISLALVWMTQYAYEQSAKYVVEITNGANFDYKFELLSGNDASIAERNIDTKGCKMKTWVTLTKGGNQIRVLPICGSVVDANDPGVNLKAPVLPRTQI